MRKRASNAVFVFLKLYDAIWWSSYHAKVYGRDAVILKVDITGLKIYGDWMLSAIFSSKAVAVEKIPASKISL